MNIPIPDLGFSKTEQWNSCLTYFKSLNLADYHVEFLRKLSMSGFGNSMQKDISGKDALRLLILYKRYHMNSDDSEFETRLKNFADDPVLLNAVEEFHLAEQVCSVHVFDTLFQLANVPIGPSSNHHIEQLRFLTPLASEHVKPSSFWVTLYQNLEQLCLKRYDFDRNTPNSREEAKMQTVHNLTLQISLLKIANKAVFTPGYDLPNDMFLKLLTLFRKRNFGTRLGANRLALSDELAEAISVELNVLESLFFIGGLWMSPHGPAEDGRGEPAAESHSPRMTIIKKLLNIVSDLPKQSEFAGIWIAFSTFVNSLPDTEVIAKSDAACVSKLSRVAKELGGLDWFITAGQCVGVSPSKQISRGFHTVLYRLLNALLTLYEPESLCSHDTLLSLICKSLSEPANAEAFWDNQFTSGVPQYYLESLYQFPARSLAPLRMTAALCNASDGSCDKALVLLQRLPIFAERLENIDDAQLGPDGSDNDAVYSLLRTRFPYITHNFAIPEGTSGEVVPDNERIETGVIQWRRPTNGWQVAFLTMKSALESFKQTQDDDFLCVIETTSQLAARVVGHDASANAPKFIDFIELAISIFDSSYDLLVDGGKIFQYCVELLDAACQSFHTEILQHLGRISFCPAVDPVDFRTMLASIQTGALKSIVLQEVSTGQYGFTIGFIKLVSTCLKVSSQSSLCEETIVLRSMCLIVTMFIFPEHLSWSYNDISQKDTLTKECLECISLMLNETESPSDDKHDSDPNSKPLNFIIRDLFLTSPEVRHNLFSYICLGSDALTMAPVEPIFGPTDSDRALIHVVGLSLSVLNRLFDSLSDPFFPLSESASSDFINDVCSPFQGSVHKRPLIIAIASLIYFNADARLPNLSLLCLRKLASLLPSTLLSVLSSSAEPIARAIRLRLAAVPIYNDTTSGNPSAISTQNVGLQIRILEFICICVGHQTGLTQLLLELNEEEDTTDPTAISAAGKLRFQLAAPGRSKLAEPLWKLIDDKAKNGRGCLETIWTLIENSFTLPDLSTNKPHETLPTPNVPRKLLKAALWMLAEAWNVHHVKIQSWFSKQPHFWTRISLPLFMLQQFDPALVEPILKILGLELFYRSSCRNSSLSAGEPSVTPSGSGDAATATVSTSSGSDAAARPSISTAAEPPTTSSVVVSRSGILKSTKQGSGASRDGTLPKELLNVLKQFFLESDTICQIYQTIRDEEKPIGKRLSLIETWKQFCIVLFHRCGFGKSVNSKMKNVIVKESWTTLDYLLQHADSKNGRKAYLELMELCFNVTNTFADQVTDSSITIIASNVGTQLSRVSEIYDHLLHPDPLSYLFATISFLVGRSDMTCLKNRLNNISEPLIGIITRISAALVAKSSSTENRSATVKTCRVLLSSLTTLNDIVKTFDPSLWFDGLSKQRLLQTFVETMKHVLKSPALLTTPLNSAILSVLSELSGVPGTSPYFQRSGFVEFTCLEMVKLFEADLSHHFDLYTHVVFVYFSLLRDMKHSFKTEAFTFAGSYYNVMQKVLNSASTTLQHDQLHAAEATLSFLETLAGYSDLWLTKLGPSTYVLQNMVIAYVNEMISYYSKPNLLNFQYEQHKSNSEYAALTKPNVGPIVPVTSVQGQQYHEVQSIYKKMLRCIVYGIEFLQRFSPDIGEMITHENFDPHDWRKLLVIGGEQDELKFRTCVTCMQLCLSSLRKGDGSRAPSVSPLRHPLTAASFLAVERHLLGLLFEMTADLIVSQSVLVLKDSNSLEADVLSLKQEILPEVSQIIGRCIRGTTGTSPGSSRRSPTPYLSPTTLQALDQDHLRAVSDLLKSWLA